MSNILAIFYVILINNFIFGSEERLLQTLFNHYDKRVRPNSNTKEVLNVQAKVTVAMLIEIKANEEIAGFNIAHYHIWVDPRLKWAPIDYDNVTSIFVPYSLVWRPKFFVYNGIDIKDLIHDEAQVVEIQKDGRVTAHHQQYVLSICKLNLKRFPFDTQFCAIGQTSNILPSDVMDIELLQPPKHNESLFIGNEEFDLTKVYSRKRYYHDMNKTMVAYEFIFELKRTPTYYITVIVVPTFFTVFLCILGMFSPGTSLGDNVKVTVGLSTFFALTVLLGIIADGLPKGPSIPLLSIHILISIFICVSAVIVSTILGFFRDYLAGSKKLPPQILCKFFYVKLEDSLFKLKAPISLNSIELDPVKQVPSKSPKCPIARSEAKVEDVSMIYSSMVILMKNQTQIKQYLEEIIEFLDRSHKNIHNIWNKIFMRIDFVFMMFFIFINFLHIYLFSKYAYWPPNKLPKALFHEETEENVII